MNAPTCGSLFSGIGGLDHGLANAGFRHRFFCESDGWRRTILASHWPGVPVHEDVSTLFVREPAGRTPADGGSAPADGGRRQTGPGIPGGLDLLCGGFPCQDLSVAGRRAGLHAGERSSLFFEYARIIDTLRPRFVLIENVPGLLSSQGGRDFGVVLGTLADLGYGVAWRVLDSRFFGVPQRRRRVFVVGTVAVGDPRAAAERCGEILAVGTRCGRHPTTRDQEGQELAPTLGASVGGGRGWDANPDRTALIASSLSASGPPSTRREDDSTLVVANTLKAHNGKGGSGISPEDTFIAETLRRHPRPGSAPGMLTVAATLSSGGHPNSNMPGRRKEDDENLVTAFSHTQGIDAQPSEDNWPTLRSEGGGHGDAVASLVRRLTPTECERLQALPDGWTNPNGDAPDSRRYAALGDAVTSSVGEWIGRRIAAAL